MEQLDSYSEKEGASWASILVRGPASAAPPWKVKLASFFGELDYVEKALRSLRRAAHWVRLA